MPAVRGSKGLWESRRPGTHPKTPERAGRRCDSCCECEQSVVVKSVNVEAGQGYGRTCGDAALFYTPVLWMLWFHAHRACRLRTSYYFPEETPPCSPQRMRLHLEGGAPTARRRCREVRADKGATGSLVLLV